MLQRINNFFRKTQAGQGIVEYALILAFVVAIAAVALSGGENSMGESIKNLFATTKEKIDNTAESINENQGGDTANP